MTDQQLVRYGSTQLRIGPWRTEGPLAHLVVYGAQPAEAEAVVAALDRLRGDGYVAVITSALKPQATVPFFEAGFSIRQQLALLRHDLSGTFERPAGLLRRGRRSDQPGVLDVDAEAFTPFWSFDDVGLHDALTATPTTRFRVRAEDTIVGYCICGRAGAEGYIQRLAIRPRAQRRGLGSVFVTDALRWMRRRAVTQAWVNTPTDNGGALALYERLGFRRDPEGLVVMSRPLDTESP